MKESIKFLFTTTQGLVLINIGIISIIVSLPRICLDDLSSTTIINDTLLYEWTYKKR